jgi:hypothetical protein
MASTSAQTAVGTTAVRLATSAIGLGGSPSWAFKNLDASLTVYFGGSNVTSSNGYPVSPGASISIPVNAGNDVWACTASGTVTVAELGVG